MNNSCQKRQAKKYMKKQSFKKICEKNAKKRVANRGIKVSLKKTVGPKATK